MIPSAVETKPPEHRDLTAAARQQVQSGPAPSWVDPCYYDKNFTPKVRGQITHLLIERQVHAESGQTFVRTAVRLESQQAVQTQSQWRLEFEPQTQSIVLHSIKIRRGDTETEHLSLEKIQFLQRESGLEGYVIDGWITLLLLLEDVRPGDSLEASYTITSRPKLMPENAFSFFTLPAGAEVGRYHFLVRHAQERPLKWKSSSPKLTPKMTTENGEVSCSWMDVQLASPEPAICTPAGIIDYPWIQISDCPDWKTVASAVFNSWKEETPGDCLTRLIKDVTEFSPDYLLRVNRAIELVQDSFRYLSADLEMGGHIPAQPEDVVRRRYGDCKDLAFLLVQILRALGVAARPVLVNTSLRGSVLTLLPAPTIFNHVIVEFEIENEKYWVDGTMKNQGGGALHRLVQDFGLGLPIDANASELVKVPRASLPSGTFEVKESFILDTAGNSSYYAVLVTATGFHADQLRTEFANESLEANAKKRLQSCANRFSKASRIGSLQYRDNRELNEFLVAEAFEINEVIKIDKATNTCLFNLHDAAIANALVGPGLKARRNPFALPFPCKHTHIIEIDFPGLDKVSLPLIQVGTRYFTFSRRSRAGPRFLRVTFSLETLAESVPPEKTPEHREQVKSVWQAASILLRLPLGYYKSQRRGDLGSLPRENRATAPLPVRPVAAAPLEMPVAAAPSQSGESGFAELPLDLQSSASPDSTAPLSKPMPPARAPISVVDSKQQSSPRRVRRSRGQQGYQGYQGISRGMLSLVLLGGSITALVFGYFLEMHPESRGLAGWLDIVGMPSFLGSFLLAAIALIECRKRRDRYPHGQVPATITLMFGCMLIFLLIWGHFRGAARRKRVAAEMDQTTGYNQDTIKFGYLNFVFHSPGYPWKQEDPRRFSHSAVLAFARNEPMRFTISITKADPDPIQEDHLKRIAEMSKESIRRESSSYQLLREGPKVRDNLPGWETETQAVMGGHEFYTVNWLLATNGIGYDLSIWGPVQIQSEVRQEADRLFTDFELVAPQ